MPNVYIALSLYKQNLFYKVGCYIQNWISVKF